MSKVLAAVIQALCEEALTEAQRTGSTNTLRDLSASLTAAANTVHTQWQNTPRCEEYHCATCNHRFFLTMTPLEERQRSPEMCVECFEKGHSKFDKSCFRLPHYKYVREAAPYVHANEED
jgi:hypothetical protein